MTATTASIVHCGVGFTDEQLAVGVLSVLEMKERELCEIAAYLQGTSCDI
jgi:hypothetical protein